MVQIVIEGADSTGYNGAPKGIQHCSEIGCDVVGVPPDDHCRRAIHAEENAIAFAARYGISVDAGTIYCTHAPCYNCAHLIVASGIRVVYYKNEYHASALQYLRECGLRTIEW